MAGGYYSSSYSQWPSVPLYLWFFGFILFLFMGLLWHINYESMIENLKYQGKLMLMVCPLLLFLVVHWLSRGDRRLATFFPEKDSLHRAGGTPWGVGALLIFLFFMISYRSYFREGWFPLLSR